MTAHVLIVGRFNAEATSVRGPAFAAGQAYANAVARAGGVPLILPPLPALVDSLPELIERVDAVVLHGGGDIDPCRYGEQPTAEQLYGIVAEHDEVELAVVRASLAADLPLLAICRGMQILNVALGGSLVQDIGSDAHWFAHHPVDIESGSRLAKVVGTQVAERCHSVHHQSIARLGNGLSLVGSSSDGMPEAIEVDEARWALGVQWHPEDDAAADAQQQALFDELLRQAHA